MFLIQGETSRDKTHHLYAILKKKESKQAPVEGGDVPSPKRHCEKQGNDNQLHQCLLEY